MRVFPAASKLIYKIPTKFRTVCMELQVTSSVFGFNWLHILVGGGCVTGALYKLQNIFAVIFSTYFPRKCLHKDRRSIRSPYIPFVLSSSDNCCNHMCTEAAGRKYLLLKVYQNICLCFTNGCVMLIAFRCKARRECDAEGNTTREEGSEGIIDGF